MLLRIRHCVDEGVLADVNVSFRIARAVELLSVLIHVLTAFDALTNAFGEDCILNQYRQADVAAELRTQFESADLPLAERRPVPDKRGCIR
jgi:hypothetical protein